MCELLPNKRPCVSKMVSFRNRISAVQIRGRGPRVLVSCQKVPSEDFEQPCQRRETREHGLGENNKRTKPVLKGQNRQGRVLESQQDSQLFLFSGTRGQSGLPQIRLSLTPARVRLFR